MKKLLLVLVLATAGSGLRAQIPVTDVAAIAQQTVDQIAILAQWAESIAQLKVQISQLDQQISLTSDIHNWAGNPSAIAGNVTLSTLGAGSLLQTYGQTPSALLLTVNSLASLSNTAQGNYRLLPSTDINGQTYQRDPLTYRRFSVLDATQANLVQAAQQTGARESDLQADIAATLTLLKAATTQAETQKQSAKLNALNAQLAAVEASRRQKVDEMTVQKMENDSRAEEERTAAADLADHDDYLANQKATSYFQTLQVRQNTDAN